jgi:hypothetical protein
MTEHSRLGPSKSTGCPDPSSETEPPMVIDAGCNGNMAAGLPGGPTSAAEVQPLSYGYLQEDPYLDNPPVSFHPSPSPLIRELL